MRAREKRRRRSGLLLTPLIDIIFLLALFFVLNTSFRREQFLEVVLPESETSRDVRAEGIVLTMRSDGGVAVNGESVAWESVTAAIAAAAEETGALEVIVQADENLEYGRAVAALDRIRLAGFEAAALQTLRPSR